ncbi:hypothetical protein TgHK011_000262 [Trichoderma gracile]|nr:hypothetical protein TgHK011_000262 [Trichoderma gracile]
MLGCYGPGQTGPRPRLLHARMAAQLQLHLQSQQRSATDLPKRPGPPSTPWTGHRTASDRPQLTAAQARQQRAHCVLLLLLAASGTVKALLAWPAALHRHHSRVQPWVNETHFDSNNPLDKACLSLYRGIWVTGQALRWLSTTTRRLEAFEWHSEVHLSDERKRDGSPEIGKARVITTPCGQPSPSPIVSTPPFCLYYTANCSQGRRGPAFQIMGLSNELLWLFTIPYANRVRIFLFQSVFRRWLKVGAKRAETDEALSIARGRKPA